MARRVNIIIASRHDDVFEEFITRIPGAKFERYTCGTPLLTRYKISRPHLQQVAGSLMFDEKVVCPWQTRCQLMHSIIRDLLDPVTIIEP